MSLAPTSTPSPLRAIERARIEVARVRGWRSRGEHAKAARALDAALCALAEAEPALPAAPYARDVYDMTLADLDRLTGGAP
jgi:hypothetical protein